MCSVQGLNTKKLQCELSGQDPDAISANSVV